MAAQVYAVSMARDVAVEGASASSQADHAFAAAFDAHAPFVGRVLRHLGVREPDIEDVCQEVFCTVHRRLPDFDGRVALRTWIYGIAWKTAANHHRSARRRRTDELPEALAIEAPQEPAMQRKRQREALSALLDRLDADKRDVFVLYEIEQLPMREVAAIVECPLQTAYSRLKAAQRQLRAAAAELGLGAGGGRGGVDD